MKKLLLTLTIVFLSIPAFAGGADSPEDWLAALRLENTSLKRDLKAAYDFNRGIEDEVVRLNIELNDAEFYIRGLEREITFLKDRKATVKEVIKEVITSEEIEVLPWWIYPAGLILLLI